MENGEVALAPSESWAAANGYSEDNYIRDIADDELGHGPIRHIDGRLVIGWSDAELREQARAEAMEEIGELKRKLAGTDYMVMKIAEGVVGADKYAGALQERAEWRARINELEKAVKED